MTYKQLGYWDNLNGRKSMAPLLMLAEEDSYCQNYVEGWNNANRKARKKSERKERNLYGDEADLRATAN